MTQYKSSSPMLQTKAEIAVHALANYLRAKLPILFGGYTDEALVDYVKWHLIHGTMSYSWDGWAITAVMVGWQQKGSEYKAFDFQHTDPAGDHWVWHAYAAEDPESAMRVAAWFAHRMPQCTVLPTLAMRNGKVRRYSPGKMMMVYRKGMALYGKD